MVETDLRDAVAAALRPLAGAAQNAMPVVGLLHSLSEARTRPQIAAFREGLREAGYIDGQNVAIEYRWADGQYNRLPALAADLVMRKVDVIATGGGTVSAVAAKNASSTIPIVLCLAVDPVATGLVASLARPTGNITGIGLFSLELVAKRIELLSGLVLKTKAVGLNVNPDNPTSKTQIKDAVSRYLYEQTKRRPMVFPVVVEV